jgi:lysophospholipase L1-like esterase
MSVHPRTLRQRIKRSVLVLLSLVFALGVAELSAWTFLEHFAGENTFHRFATVAQLRSSEDYPERFIRHYYLGYTPKPNFELGDDRHNRLGYRGDGFPIKKPEGEFRIACLGGSTTYGAGVDNFREAFPARLGRMIANSGLDNCRVINAGAHGWTSWETLINFELRVLDLDPDLIIVHHGVNDIQPRLTWPPSSYTSENLSFRARPTPVENHQLLEHSTLGRMVLIQAGLIESPSRLERTYGARDPGTFFGADFRGQVLQGVYPQGIFKRVSVEQMLDRNLPRYFDRNLRSLVAIARSNDIQVLFVGVPFSPVAMQTPVASYPAMQEAQAEMAGVLKRIASTTAAYYFDLPTRFPKENGLFTDGIHTNAKGHSVKARKIFECLESRKLLPAG